MRPMARRAKVTCIGGIQYSRLAAVTAKSCRDPSELAWSQTAQNCTDL